MVNTTKFIVTFFISSLIASCGAAAAVLFEDRSTRALGVYIAVLAGLHSILWAAMWLRATSVPSTTRSQPPGR